MTLKSRLTGLIAIATCCLARLSAQAEYHGFNTASGADGMVQEVRWPVPFPVIASFTLLANGSFNLGGTGAVNQAYVLLASSNLVPPVSCCPKGWPTSAGEAKLPLALIASCKTACFSTFRNTQCTTGRVSGRLSS